MSDKTNTDKTNIGKPGIERRTFVRGITAASNVGLRKNLTVGATRQRGQF
jgi:hypothetical protein